MPWTPGWGRRPDGAGWRAAPRRWWAWQDGLQADTISGVDGAARYARPTTGEELRATLLRLVAAPNLASKAWVTDQYDRFVQGNTALAQPDDAGVVRVDEATGLGVVGLGEGGVALHEPVVLV